MEPDTRAHAGSATRRRPRDRAPPRRPLPDRPADRPRRDGQRLRGRSTSGSTAPARSRSCTTASATTTAFADRFKREARAAARLDHPNVVNVFDQGDDPDVDGGTLYLVMELVPGHTLRDVIRDEAPMPPARRWRCWSRSSRRSPPPTGPA